MLCVCAQLKGLSFQVDSLTLWERTRNGEFQILVNLKAEFGDIFPLFHDIFGIRQKEKEIWIQILYKRSLWALVP